MVFDLPVMGERVKPQQVTALHLFCSLAFMGTGAIIFIYNYQITYWGLALLIAGIALVVLTIFKNKWVIGHKINLILRIKELAISVAIAALSYYEQWKFPIIIFTSLTVAILFSLYWERGIGKRLYAHIDEAGVRLPATSRRRFIGWVNIEQVLLRHGVLSIDCVDNKLYQFDVSGYSADDEAFEAFCKAQVAANAGKRKKDEW